MSIIQEFQQLQERLAFFQEQDLNWKLEVTNILCNFTKQTYSYGLKICSLGFPDKLQFSVFLSSKLHLISIFPSITQCLVRYKAMFDLVR